jgi:plasmid stabilization system protein ParE
MTGPFSGYRSTVVGLFRIVYRIATRTRIEIAYIRHCKRAPTA